MKILLLALNAKYIHTSLALRYIKAYCKEDQPNIQIIETSINNNDLEIIKSIYKAQPDILGISCYIWNMAYVRTLVPTLKKLLPKTTLILGGPEVSYDAEAILETCEVDLIMEGEGEETWKTYLDYRVRGIGDLDAIDGIIYRDENHQIRRNAPRKPLNLEKLPFVYENLSGLEHKIIYYEASRGCPFNCQYCLSSIEHGVRFVPLERVKSHMAFFLQHKVKQVKFVDRTFNTKKDYAMAIWAYIIQNDNGYTNFHFEIAAELIVPEMYTLLQKARPGLIQLEIGVQSTNPEVLKIIKRPMPFEDIKQVVLDIKAMNNIHQHLDLIAGLPKENYASFRKSFNDVMSVRPEQFQLGFLKLLKGSGLRRDAESYGLVFHEEAPYEILYTKEISFDEILRLHGIDELVERYYNSGRFKNVLEYLFEAFNTPFDFFEALSIYWEAQGLDVIEHNKMAYLFHLQDFCEAKAPFNKAINTEKVKELIRYDYLMHEAFNEVPNKLETMPRAELKDIYNKVIRDDKLLAHYAPGLLEYAPRQRYRLTCLDAYAHLYGDTQVVLFDYSGAVPQSYRIEKEFLSYETERAY